MSQTNSTVSISNHQLATNVSPLDSQASSKNDISKNSLVSDIHAFMDKFQQAKSEKRSALKNKNLERIRAFRKEHGMIKTPQKPHPMNYVCTTTGCYN